VLVRLRAYAGLWSLIGLLGAVLVFVTAGAGPAARSVADRALRELVGQAPWTSRDLAVVEPAVTLLGSRPTNAEQVRDYVEGLLPPELAEVVAVSWGYQHTTIRPPDATGLVAAVSLTGDGVTDAPAGLMPLVTVHHQTGLGDALTIVEGQAPGSQPAGDAVEATVEAMASVDVAEALGLRVGGTYRLLPGVAARMHGSAEAVAGRVVPITLTGVFQPRDATGPVWEPAPRLLQAGPRPWPDGNGGTTFMMQATLVTNQAGIDTLLAAGLDEYLNTRSVARIRLDPSRLDAAWAGPASAAVARLSTDQGLRPEMRVETGLIELLDEFERQAAAARAVAAVVAGGLVGTGIGLLLLAARVAVERRRAELALLRARGASLSTIAGRMAGEAALVMLPAAVIACLPAPRAGPLIVAAVAVLIVPATAIIAGRLRVAPARITGELLVLLLAGLGLVLFHQRGAGRVGTDPYLSAVPVLVALAAGMVALRCYPWPLRALGVVAARRPGVVGFLGLARAGRAAPAAALPLLVLVLAVAVGGFAGTVYTSVTAARDAAAVRAVGADARVEAAGLTDRSAAAVEGVAGVEAVAAAGREGQVRIGGRVDQDARVVVIDAPAYQEILAAIGAPGRLPEAVVSARPGVAPVPVLAPAGTDPARELTVEVGGVEYPVEVVGDVAGVPALHPGRTWMLVPRQALAEPSTVDEILVAGAGADLAAVVRAAGADPQEATVTSLAGYRADLAGAGFNRGLTLLLVIGTAGAAVGGLLAIGLALVVHASTRGRTLSLLRTMGLSARQGRALLLVELVPVTTFAMVVGAATGTALPGLLAPGLGLTGFTGGVPVEVGLDLRAVSLLTALLGLFVIGGLLAESTVNRRLGLGQVLRVE
jgi:putative ABC transport system permease protein